MSHASQALALLLLPLAGCYLAHGVDGPSALDGAPTPLDASTGPTRLDAARPFADGSTDPPSRPLDAGPLPDAGDVLPIEPDPDAGVDPPTGPWVDPPPPPPGEPTLVAVGGPIALDDAADSGGPPSVVWSGSAWGAAWSGHFRVLSEDARPLSPAVPMPHGISTGLDFAVGRYAVATTGAAGPSRTRLDLGAFDRNGRPAAGWHETIEADEADLARLETEGRWVVAVSASGAEGREDVMVFSADDAMRPVSTPLRLGSGIGDVRVVGVKSRVLAVWNVADGWMAQVVAGDPPHPEGGPFRVFETSPTGDSRVELEVFRDVAAVVALDGSDVRLALVDARTRSIRTEPTLIGQSALTDRRPGIAVSHERGFFVACWGTGSGGGGSGGNDGIALQVIGADGTLWGEPIQLVTGEPNVGGVDCGWNGREIAVIWWRASGDAGYNAIYAQRMRPTFL